MKPLLTALALTFAITLPGTSAAQPPADTNPLFDEPRLIVKTMTWIEDFNNDESGEPHDGFYPELGNMITGAGWISGGPGYRRHLFGGNALVDVSAAVSWRAYKIAQGRLEFPHLLNDRVTVGSKLLWQDYTQVRYYGLGRDTLETGVSDFRMQATNVVGYATWRPRPSVAITGSAGWLSRPSLSASTGSFDRDEPDTLTLYAGDPAARLSRQPRFAHGELSIIADTRNHPSYPTTGALVRGAWSTYRDQPTGTWAFDRYEGEAACFLPILRRGVIAAHFWGVFTDTLEGRAVPFYLMPSLGGHNTLRGYADYRFHDRHLVAANLESRWALFAHVDSAVFFDAGNVAARAEDLDFVRTSYGVGVRLHTARTTVARLDVARSKEGWRFIFKLTDPIRLGRLNKRTAALPFVP
jgi:outer membrane protein assembly factor BamA